MPVQAADDAEKAATLHPSWSRPYERLAQAKLGAKEWSAAVAACRRGEALFDSNSNVTTPFTALLDTIAICAAMEGNVQGFDGRILEVGLHQDKPLCAVVTHRARPNLPGRTFLGH